MTVLRNHLQEGHTAGACAPGHHRPGRDGGACRFRANTVHAPTRGPAQRRCSRCPRSGCWMQDAGCFLAGWWKRLCSCFALLCPALALRDGAQQLRGNPAKPGAVPARLQQVQLKPPGNNHRTVGYFTQPLLLQQGTIQYFCYV